MTHVDTSTTMEDYVYLKMENVLHSIILQCGKRSIHIVDKSPNMSSPTQGIHSVLATFITITVCKR